MDYYFYNNTAKSWSTHHVNYNLHNESHIDLMNLFNKIIVRNNWCFTDDVVAVNNNHDKIRWKYLLFIDIVFI